ncbi:MAG: CvpA family protein [Clostridia bacterium]|nr:CvpA family protein [Clostridia bacterium]
MTIVIDLILVAVILFFVLTSARRGFVKVLIETVGFIAAVVVAFTISTPLAELTYDKIIEPPVIEAAVNAVGESAEHEAWNALPDFLIDSENAFFSTTVNSFTEKITANMSDGVETAVKKASQEVVKPVASKVIGLLYSVILVIVLSIVAKFLAKILNKLFSFSFVGKINRTLGGVVGLVKGTVVAVILCAVVSLILSFTGKPFLIFSEDTINQTYLFKFLTNIIF